MPVSTQNEDLKQNTTVSNQFNRTFSSAVKEVSGAVDGFLKSSPNSIGEALGNVSALAGSLGKLGISALGSASTALNQLSSLGNYSKFTDNFAAPSKIKDLKPNDTEALRYQGGLTYPENLAEYFISYTFKTYKRKVPLGAKVDLPLITINLPIPANLAESFGMQYSDKALGVAGYVEQNMPQMTGPVASEQVQGIGEQIGKDVTSMEGLYYGARTVAGLSDSVGGAVDKATGTVLNPFQALVFQGVNLRSHSFSYKFSPNSQRENETLRKIVYEFKRRMHPQKDNLLYQFPDTVDIAFNKQNGEPYFFKTCFLESMTVNYAPSGTPAFFAGSGYPAEIDISLNFKEIAPITREDFKDPSSAQQYSPF